MFPIKNGLKQGDALSPLLSNFAYEYSISWVQVHQDGLKLNGTHYLLVYADNVKPLTPEGLYSGRAVSPLSSQTATTVAANSASKFGGILFTPI